MSDPYLKYDKSTIQVNVFHVSGPLRGSNEEKNKLLHKEAYIFSPMPNEP